MGERILNPSPIHFASATALSQTALTQPLWNPGCGKEREGTTVHLGWSGQALVESFHGCQPLNSPSHQQWKCLTCHQCLAG